MALFLNKSSFCDKRLSISSISQKHSMMFRMEMIGAQISHLLVYFFKVYSTFEDAELKVRRHKATRLFLVFC